MVKYILVIKGVNEPEYRAIKEDLTEQYQAKGMEVPIFSYLPQDYAEIELVWIDEEMERDAFSIALEKTNMGKSIDNLLKTEIVDKYPRINYP